jgi:chromosome segregation ATPase
MKPKTVIILLVILCLGLAAVLLVGLKQKQSQIADLEAKRSDLSTNWAAAERRLGDQQRVNITLETNLAKITLELISRSNELVQTSAKLAKAEAEAKAEAQRAKEEITLRENRIKELETQRDDLTKRMSELNVSITNLEKQIADTEKKLAASEGDRSFLLKELKRLQAEKAELERQFNNLAFLREQVRKLRDELSIAKRLEWIRRGLYGSPSQKGAERLQQGFVTPLVRTSIPPSLDVELRQDGSVKIAPSTTNAPPK